MRARALLLLGREALCVQALLLDFNLLCGGLERWRGVALQLDPVLAIGAPCHI